MVNQLYLYTTFIVLLTPQSTQQVSIHTLNYTLVTLTTL